MNTRMNERKNIIVSLKSRYGERKKGIDKRIRFLQFFTFLNALMSLFCGTILLASLILEPLGFEFFKWQKMGLLTILSLSFFLGLPGEVYELKLLKHLKRIAHTSDFPELEVLNTELKVLINKLNGKLKYNGIIILLAFVILILGFMQVLSDSENLYWNYAKIPVLIFFLIVVTRFYTMNKKLTENIRKTEAQCV